MVKRSTRFIYISLAALLILGLFAGALVAAGTVSYSTVDVLLHGNKVGQKGENYPLGNGVSVPFSLSYVDEKGGSTTYLPVRKVSELLNIPIGWDGATGSVLLGEDGSNVYDGGTGAALKGSTVSLTEEKVGDKLVIYTFTNAKGMTAQILNRGGNIYSIVVPDKNGKMVDVVLDRADPAGESNPFGPVIGRHANRIGGAAFTLNGKAYTLQGNNGNNIGGPPVNNLHSAPGNMGNKYWEGKIVNYSNIPVLELSSSSTFAEDGFPGNLTAKVSYALTDDSALVLRYWAVADEDTIINFTNHAYFNLAGHDSGNVFSHELWLNADYYTPVYDDSIPTGEIASVKGTPMDFTKSRPVYGTANVPLPKPMERGGVARLALNSGFDQIDWFDGYDNYFVLNGAGYRKVSTLYEPTSGRAMDVFTTTPGVQVFTANSTYTDPEVTKDGASYEPYCGIALETQYFPDSINKPWFPSTVYKAGEVYTETTAFQFYVK